MDSQPLPCKGHGHRAITPWISSALLRDARFTLIWGRPVFHQTSLLNQSSPLLQPKQHWILCKGTAKADEQAGWEQKQALYLPVHWEFAATLRAVKLQVAREYRCTESPITTELFAGHDLQTESQLSVVLTLCTRWLPLKHLSWLPSLQDKLHFPNTGSILQYILKSSIKSKIAMTWKHLQNEFTREHF